VHRVSRTARGLSAILGGAASDGGRRHGRRMSAVAPGAVGDEAVVSVVMPAYNAASVVGASIRSVVAQQFTRWELIVVDDHSSDDTALQVQVFAARDGRIRLIQLEENRGPAVARNAAIAAARGRYVAFLDCDDLWLPGKLGRQLEFMEASGAAFSYGAYYKIDAGGHRCGRVDVPPRTTYRELLKTNVIGCLTAMYDTRSVGRVFMPGIRKGQDYGLWLDLLKRVNCAYGMPEPLAEYRVRSGSISANKLESSLWVWRVYRRVERLSLPRAAYYFTHYAIHGLRDRRAGRRQNARSSDDC
jgi:teichuronic acid biosynthesis glycosyltransferase TuaG